MIANEKWPTDEALRQKIEQRAYEIWENEGGPHGRDFDHWLRAEAEILSPLRTTPTPSVQQQSTPPKAKDKR